MVLASRSTVWQKQDDNNKYKKNRYDINNPTFNSFSTDVGKDNFLSKFDLNRDEYVKFISFFRRYPDCLIDLITPPESKFRLYAYQRMLLRIFFRYKYVFLTATRGSTKSFNIILAYLLMAILYPKIKLSLTAGGSKEQAKNIASEKLAEIFELYPILRNEVKDKREGKDFLEVFLHSGSSIRVIAASNNSRGMRAHRGCIEEAILIDTELLNDIIIPLFNVDRICANGLSDPNEFLNSQMLFVTTAGFAGTDIYNKMIHYFKEMCDGKKSICIGTSYELPMYHGLLKQDKVEDILSDPNYSPISFAREYKSEWIGFSNKSFFNLNELNSCRVLKHAEFMLDNKKHPNDFTFFSYDVARSGGSNNDASSLNIFRCTERKDGSYIKNVINLKSYEDKNKYNNDTSSKMHFKNQCLEIKRNVEIYSPKAIVIDALGMGAGLLDYLTDVTEDEEYGKTYPAYCVVSVNGEDIPYDYSGKSVPILHLIKTSGGNASNIMNDMVNILKGHIQNKNLRLLIDEREAQEIVKKTKTKQKDVSMEDEVNALLPYMQTTLLINELMQLEAEVSGNNIKLKPISSTKRKDRFSSLTYGLWWCVRYLEDRNKKNLDSSMEDLMCFLSAGF